METIDPAKNEVNDIGQTSSVVTYDEKIEKIIKTVKQNNLHNKNDASEPATPAR
jgi:hypothetical protein